MDDDSLDPELTADRLAALGAESLADILLELAGKHDDVERLVARLTSGPGQNAGRFRAGLAGLLRRNRLISYHEAGSYADELRDLLADVESGVTDPQTGAELVAAFYRADEDAFEAADDSDGLIGDVFRVDARELFARYASACHDKEWLTGLVFDLVSVDDYGVRDAVLDGAAAFLPEAALRDLAQRMWEVAGPPVAAASHAERDWAQDHWFLLIEMVARELNDPQLFERARRAFSPDLGTAACIDIARAWLIAGDAATALEWLERIEAGDRFMTEERDELLWAVHERLGNRDEVERLAWKAFDDYRSADTLRDLLDVIGDERHDDVVTDAVSTILEEKTFAPHDAVFLIECGRTREAADYVVERTAQLDGNEWPALVSLAEVIEAADHPLAATVLYRALLDSILGRGQSRAYHHGAGYLLKLERLAAKVSEWRSVPSHAEYVALVRERHGRKRSFWAQTGE